MYSAHIARGAWAETKSCQISGLGHPDLGDHQAPGDGVDQGKRVKEPPNPVSEIVRSHVDEQFEVHIKRLERATEPTLTDGPSA